MLGLPSRTPPYTSLLGDLRARKTNAQRSLRHSFLGDGSPVDHELSSLLKCDRVHEERNLNFDGLGPRLLPLHLCGRVRCHADRLVLDLDVDLVQILGGPQNLGRNNELLKEMRHQEILLF